MKYIDIHSHLNLTEFLDDYPEVLSRMQEADVGTICVGVDYPTSLRAFLLASEYPHVWAAIGQHPTDSKEAFDILGFDLLAANPRVVAIGECGLDYFRLSGTEDEKRREKDRQKDIFMEHIRIARNTKKPLMIHARPSKGTMDAYQDVIDILSGQLLATGYSVPANFHFFVGDVSIAKQILELGGTMSFDGPITFSQDYDEVIRFIPLDRIMAETDSPFASPAPHRGKRSEPLYVSYIYDAIARIKGISEEEVARTLTENAVKFFNLT